MVQIVSPKHEEILTIIHAAVGMKPFLLRDIVQKDKNLITKIRPQLRALSNCRLVRKVGRYRINYNTAIWQLMPDALVVIERAKAREIQDAVLQLEPGAVKS